MNKTDLRPSPGNNRGRILLIGDIGKAFLDAEEAGHWSCEVQANMIDGIEAAAKESFRGIGVVMAAVLARLSSALKALRKVSSAANIVLLAQMYEEPKAKNLTDSASAGTGMADDYLICPIRFSQLVDCICCPEGLKRSAGPERFVERQVTEAHKAAPADSRIELKIRQLEKLATEDELTGLKNRRYILEFARQIIERARKENGRVTLLVFDIDDFKHYNDVYGHSIGDEILQQAAVLMRRSCRPHDVVGRVGGDEFAAVFWDDPHKPARTESERRSTEVDHPSEAIFIAKRFRKELEKTRFNSLGPEGKGVLTISGGLASFPRDGSTTRMLFEQADTALLEAKRSGKNRIYLVGGPRGDIADIGQ